jgi:uncharacterized membrane protein
MIEVNSTAAPEQLASTLRAFLIALGGYRVGKGWVDAGLVSAAVPLLLVGVPYVWNQLKIRRTNEKMQTLAASSPDGVVK